MTERLTITHVAGAIASRARKHKAAIAAIAIVCCCAPAFWAIRHFWDTDVTLATRRMLAAHLFFFDAAFMILAAAVLTRRLTLPVFAACFVLADIPAAQHLIDVDLHRLLERAGVFHWFAGANASEQVANARSAKMVLSALLMPILMGQVLLARTRSLDRAMALLGTLAVLLTTILFHTALPDSTMRAENKDAVYVSRYALTVDAAQAAQFCYHLGSNCTSVQSRSDLASKLKSAGLDGIVRRLDEIADGAYVATATGARVTGTDGRQRLVPVLVAFRMPREGETTTLLVDARQLKTIQTRHERSFALLCIAAHGFWTLFVTVLCVLHHWRGRARVFRNPQAT